MSKYWQEHYQAVAEMFPASPLKQVGKTVNGVEVSGEQIALIAGNVARALNLGVEDSLMDLCCGNGLLTRQFSPLVHDVVGVDFTSALIDSARAAPELENLQYIQSDVLRLDSRLLSGRRKILMYEALQHFSEAQFAGLLSGMRDLDADSLFFVGSVPDKARLHRFYDTDEKFAYYQKCEDAGRPHMGRWWLKDEIDRLASAAGFKPTFRQQPATLYTAHYRFDVLLARA